MTIYIPILPERFTGFRCERCGAILRADGKCMSCQLQMPAFRLLPLSQLQYPTRVRANSLGGK
jgi:hypothetical protein